MQACILKGCAFSLRCQNHSYDDALDLEPTLASCTNPGEEESCEEIRVSAVIGDFLKSSNLEFLKIQREPSRHGFLNSKLDLRATLLLIRSSYVQGRVKDGI